MTTKIYGNSRSDGFSLFVTLVGALFVGGGFLLAHVSSLTMLLSLPVMLALVAVMVVRSKKWDVMSELVAVAAETPADAAVEAPVTFAMKPDTEAVATAASLPKVEKPKSSAVETNTAVA
jgi:hypothetical protein